MAVAEPSWKPGHHAVVIWQLAEGWILRQSHARLDLKPSLGEEGSTWHYRSAYHNAILIFHFLGLLCGLTL